MRVEKQIAVIIKQMEQAKHDLQIAMESLQTDIEKRDLEENLEEIRKKAMTIYDATIELECCINFQKGIIKA